MVTIRDIKEKRKELDDLEQEYLNITPPCNNLECAFFRPENQGSCSWSVLLEDCKDYKH